MIRNEIKDLTAVLMKWSEYNNFEKQYEVILAADPFFHGCSF